MQLDPGLIHVWVANQSEFDLEFLGTNCLHWLQEEEARRFFRLRANRHKLQLLLGQFMVRTLLSAYHPEVAPANWSLVKNVYGKPALNQTSHPLPFFFNLSHSQGRLVVAVARKDGIGVDIEFCSRTRRFTRIANRYFASEEVRGLLAVADHQKQERFYRLWTLKEAYIKARGLGLAIPLQKFSFSYADSGEIFVAFEKQLGDDPNAWQFWQKNLDQNYMLAVANMRGKNQPDLQLDLRSFDSGQWISSASR